ncbi:3-oxoacyl-ACP synthase III family protein [Dysgonomonas sp. HGC4]|uniref:3-oxoacyl-ACP synthase III family protein n=1 Tax=Dysgonomonas sp. HGC4 TaxID=1658009 RepID=UPI0006811149|nr:ketoacyl-ACP synthase III [Dysgonomonas sp. HGC4]MBD8349076.1 ketoacyl-ACP synthase III [Dysgonomonas sp. HGC4]
MQAYIKAISYYLPEKNVSNEELIEKFPEWTVGKIASKVGINHRHVVAEDETSGDMAEKAAKNLFAEYNISPESIDFVILCTQSPDYFLPTTACVLQERLGVPTSSGAFDFNLGCSGYIYGLAVAKGLVTAEIAKNVLFLTAETYSKHIHAKDKGNRTIFGDAASATIISNEGFAEIMNFDLGTDGKGAENLIVKTGGFRQKEKANDIVFDDNGNPQSSDFLYMNGAEIFNFTLDIVPNLVAQTLMKNSLTKKDIDLCVFHQANRYMLDFLRKKLKIDPDRFFYYMSEVGNTVSSTIPIAIKEAIKEGKLSGNVLLAGFGVGYSWGGTVLKVDK